MPGFYICKEKHITQGSEDAWIWLNNACINCFDYGRTLNMPGQSFKKFWICIQFYMPRVRIWLGCEYARITQGAEYV